jgi:hypothetical protein
MKTGTNNACAKTYGASIAARSAPRKMPQAVDLLTIANTAIAVIFAATLGARRS